MMRLTKFNPETGLYEYIEPAKTQEEFIAQRKAVIQKLGEFEENAECRVQNAEWISVEDRLPEDNGDELIVCTEDGCVGAARFTIYTKEQGFCWMENEGSDFYDGDLIEDVTHWMPLPYAPKMKGADDEQR